jgi:hypothetical protein
LVIISKNLASTTEYSQLFNCYFVRCGVLLF